MRKINQLKLKQNDIDDRISRQEQQHYYSYVAYAQEAKGKIKQIKKRQVDIFKFKTELIRVKTTLSEVKNTLEEDQQQIRHCKKKNTSNPKDGNISYPE